MSMKKYPMSEQDAQQILTKTKELKGGTIMENLTNNVSLEDFEIDFDFDDLVEETESTPVVMATPVTDGANALAPEATVKENVASTPKKTTRKTKKAKLEIVKENDVVQPTESTPESSEMTSDASKEEEVTKTTTTQTRALTTEEKAKNGIAKLSHIETYLNEKFLEREEVIANVLRTLVVGTNMLLLGEPGTGKSDLIQSATQMIEGAEHFQWLVNRTSDPAELVGPYSIKAMEQDKFVRKTAGKLPEAHVAFIDEVFKCNEPTLNMLLPLINEKIFYNGPVPTKVPLISMFAASNELPEDEALDALYDRILIRMVVEYVKDSSNRRKMLELYATKGAGIKVPQKITLDELLSIQEVATNMPVSKNVIKSLDTLITKLKRNGISVSDRRLNNCIKIMRGSAILAGRQEVSLMDLRSLVYVLWEKEEDIQLLQTEIDKLVDPYADKFRQFSMSFEEIKTTLDSAQNEQEFTKLSVENKKGLETIMKKTKVLIQEINKECGSSYDVKPIVEKLNEITNYHTGLMSRLFDVDSADGGLGF